MALNKNDLCLFIRSKVHQVYTLDCFTEWLRDELLTPTDLVIINNSLIYRDLVETKKSSKYLALKINDEEIEKAELVVAMNCNINADFRHFPKSSTLPSTVSLEDACDQGAPKLKSVSVYFGWRSGLHQRVQPTHPKLGSLIVWFIVPVWTGIND